MSATPPGPEAYAYGAGAPGAPAAAGAPAMWPAEPPPDEGHHDEPALWALRAAKVVVVFVDVVVITCLVMLTLGFLLRLFGASTDAEFTRWVYRSVERIMQPFRGMFPEQSLGEQSVLDVSLLFAMIIYALVALALHGLVSWLTQRITRLSRRPRRRPQPQPATAPYGYGPGPGPAGGPVPGPPPGRR